MFAKLSCSDSASIRPLTYWLLGDVLVISQSHFLNSVYELISWALPVKFVKWVSWSTFDDKSTMVPVYYSDVTMSAMASQKFTQTFVQAQIKENIKAPRHWPLWGEFTADRWIPRKKGHLTRKMFPFGATRNTENYDAWYRVYNLFGHQWLGMSFN